MKKFCFILLFSAFSSVSVATTLTTPLSYLNAMTEAHRQQNYEQFYIIQQGEEVDSLRYRHAYVNGKEFAQLLRLDYAREEIVLRDNRVSYFGDFQPFSLPATKIRDDLPAVLYTDFNQLEGYLFIDAGRSRIADRFARVIRIIPKDEFRYQYELWIDEENHLLLRSDLLDRDRTLLEQFKVIQHYVDEQIALIAEPIQTLTLPALIPPKSHSEALPVNWSLSWVPIGFKALAIGRQSLAELLNDEDIESQFYSDGLFSFTVYRVKNQGVVFNEQFWRQGKTSIYSQTIGENDIVIIGEIPLVSARYIVQQIQFLQNIPQN